MEALLEISPEEVVQIVGLLNLQLYRKNQEAARAREEIAKLLEQLAQERAEKEKALLWKESHDRLLHQYQELAKQLEELRQQLAQERAEKEKALLWKESHDRLVQKNQELSTIVEELRGQLAQLAGRRKVKQDRAAKGSREAKVNAQAV